MLPRLRRLADPRAQIDQFQQIQAIRAASLADRVREFGRVLPGVPEALAAVAAGLPGVTAVQSLLTGNLRANERVELKRTARVYGDVEAPVVVVEEGVIFEGHCRMSKPSPVSEVAGRDLAVVPLKR